MRCHSRCVWIAVLLASFVWPNASSAEETTQSRAVASVGVAAATPPSSRRTRATTGSATSGDQAARARPTTQPAPLTMSKESGSQLQLLVRRAAIATLLAGALAAALFFSMGRRQGHPGQPGSESLKLISTLSLAPRCSVSLVQVQGQTVLVARDASGVKEMLLVPQRFDSLIEPHPELETVASTFEVRDYG